MDTQAQRQGAFAAFDLDGTGAITQFDLRYAFQACESIATLVTEKDVVMAMRRTGTPVGSMINFRQFSAMCDVVEGFLKPRRQMQEYASVLPLQEEQEQVEYCQQSPRRTTRSMPLELWHEKNEEIDPSPLPHSPRSPRACLGELPGMDAVAHAFYAFDMDYTGAVSAVELPHMLRMVPKRKGGNLGRPAGDAKKMKKQQRMWDDKLRGALADIGKQPSDLLNLHDFQALIDFFDPPPPLVVLEPEDEGYETTESERQRRAEEAERLRREEEARQEAERINAGTLVVNYDGSYVVLHFCEDGDTVGSIMRKIQEKIPEMKVKQMRLLGRGFEMDLRNTLSSYGVKVGHPQTHGGDILQLMLRAEFREKQEIVEVVSGMVNIQRPDGSIVRIYAEDDEPIEHFMNRIEEQEGTPVPYQRLVVHGRELNSRKTLKDYEVTFGPEGDILDLLLRDVPAVPRIRGW